MNAFTCSVVVVLCLAFGAVESVAEPTFVYVNDDTSPNTVSGFEVRRDGSLVPVPGSPMPTGGHGSGGGFYASNRTTVSANGSLLFVANSGSSDISVFRVDRRSGSLVPVPGSPFATGASNTGLGISVASTPDGRFLIAANPGSQHVVVFTIASNGALSPTTGSPFLLPGDPDGIKVSPNGKLLAIAFPHLNGGSIGIFRITRDGTLVTEAESLIEDLGIGGAAGVDINCDSNRLYAGEANQDRTIVDVFALDRLGKLNPLAGAPFETDGAANSNVVLLSPKDDTLFVTNQYSGTVTAARTVPAGLTLVPGSPFPMGGGQPAGMATDAKGKFLFVSSYANGIAVLAIGRDGSLQPVAGSPFAGRPGTAQLSVTAFPAKSCTIQVAIDVKPGDDRNSLNRRSRGKTTVALFSSKHFDASTVERSSVRFLGAPAAASEAVRDINGDGRRDVVFRFDTSRLDLSRGAREGCMAGTTATGRPFHGCDRISVK